jgi:vanillate O-demethylase ferredoxin subunit
MRNDNLWSDATIIAVRALTDDIREISFAPDAGIRPYAPGSHVDVRVRAASGPETRSYSLVGAGDGETYRIAVRRASDGRGGSLFMHGLAAGDRFAVSSPVSTFECTLDAPDYLLIAGGIGITPILGMAETLARRGASYRIAYAGAARSKMAYLDELIARHGDRLAVFESAAGARLDLDGAFARLHPSAEVYLCGPMRLLDGARTSWKAAGRATPRLRFETFGSSGHFPPEPFTVRLPRLGRDVLVPRDVSMLDALEAAGIGVLADCRRGECGLCVVEIIGCDGRIDHRDVFLSEHQRAEGRKLCACVSRVVGGAVSIDPAFRGDVKLMV